MNYSENGCAADNQGRFLTSLANDDSRSVQPCKKRGWRAASPMLLLTFSDKNRAVASSALR